MWFAAGSRPLRIYTAEPVKLHYLGEAYTQNTTGRRNKREREVKQCMPITYPVYPVCVVVQADGSHGDTRSNVMVTVSRLGLVSMSVRKIDNIDRGASYLLVRFKYVNCVPITDDCIEAWRASAPAEYLVKISAVA